jgi:PPM family protein phosphatase
MNMITRLKKLLAPAAKQQPSQTLRPTPPDGRAVFSPSLEIDFGFVSDPGCHRRKNEDFAHCIKPSHQETRKRKGVLALVCDGMGGHAGGEIASRLAADIITRSYYASSKSPQLALAEAFREANRAIFNAAKQDPRLLGMGTTSTALVLHDGAAISAQVGDSRLYLARGEQLYLMSEDHSAVMEMVRRGMLSLDEARCHEDKNIVLRALGVQAEVVVSTWEHAFPARAGDCFVMCTDGLYDLVNDVEILETVRDSQPQTASERLTKLARERGGYDNITVGVLKLHAERANAPDAVTHLRPTRELNLSTSK